ncbi:monovalent cation/H(+) antiporter subunit G [Candidatus Aciduliprofundum boonei]|uniref:Monovalent cation/proton antiporter, MnhG/PhaG subunit n=1 Tax=Aciduliprofundum boonei (strain DSM 19572 / T469) TaxID=439481 RepID=B5IAN9_ACIB4|nr:monovalent cation/H(+) antiporter subunit G [Candidatus Aciduliprofundum boonei]ADD08195.1 monovalent cation/proton antiporter, MnhG/PhaG subunit [Aciduliprofundum boonei T469]EDY35134.1 monovalent cation/proton antiporter, MnhG/PhaG subunit subfamily [Aciduliprofundum boonei T469]EDY36814.1 monovalent cation/proton antiporter, MnhG/PhaG subunit subfamily [Aciduliprofundum boonei T469]HII54569.1 Na+/H+ antiporter subunit G [Candidatus Aciduliprofundum boonei]
MSNVILLILQIIGYIFISIGTFFLLLASIGLLRMPDVYNRMQTATKATTLGALSVLVGIGLIDLGWLPKSLIIAAFIVLTAPIGASALARASYKHGVKLWEGSVVDKYKEEKEED